MAARLTLEGEEETRKAMQKAADEADDPDNLRDAAELILAPARALGPNDTGQLAASYTLGGEPAGVVSPLIWAGIIEYGWPARGRPAYRRVEAAGQSVMADMEALIEKRIDETGDRYGV